MNITYKATAAAPLTAANADSQLFPVASVSYNPSSPKLDLQHIQEEIDPVINQLLRSMWVPPELIDNGFLSLEQPDSVSMVFTVHETFDVDE